MPETTGHDDQRRSSFQLSPSRLLRWTMDEHRRRRSVLGIHESLFRRPHPAPFRGTFAPPLGPAAGLHTQSAQGIVAAWLCGARIFELAPPRHGARIDPGCPAVDAEDECCSTAVGSPLTPEEQLAEVAKAWFLIRALGRTLGLEDGAPAFLFGCAGTGDMAFADPERTAAIVEAVRQEFLTAARRTPGAPDLDDLETPSRLAAGAVLSLSPVCGPEDVERAARLLVKDMGLPVLLKLPPTLLGRDAAREILNGRLGWEWASIPASAFQDMPPPDETLNLIRALGNMAGQSGQSGHGQIGQKFSLRLTGRLAMVNTRRCLEGDVVHMSGRALYPLALNLWHRLAEALAGDKPAVWFSGGADALNVAEVFSCGAEAVLMASNLLRPGGCARLRQCLDNLESAMTEAGATDLPSFAGGPEERARRLARAAEASLTDPRYQRSSFAGVNGIPKLWMSALPPFDCIAAPCEPKCPLGVDIPGLAARMATGDRGGALDLVMAKNPMPGLLGHLCPRTCQVRCARSQYDLAVRVGDLEREAAGQCRLPEMRPGFRMYRAAVVGGGPAGLSAAGVLAAAGVRVTVLEASGRLGGMAALTPFFRLPPEALARDIARLTALGVEFRTHSRMEGNPGALLAQGFDAVLLATGFPRERRLSVEGVDALGSGQLWTSLDLMRSVSAGARPTLGRHVLVVGGGGGAVDAARTALRLTDGTVTLVYRRARRDMPADDEAVTLMLEEGARLEPQALPLRVLSRDGRLTGLECRRTAMGRHDVEGRRVFAPQDERFVLEADCIVTALGREADRDLTQGLDLRRNGSVITVTNDGRTSRGGIRAAGDLATGPESVLSACASGACAAHAICRELNLTPPQEGACPPRLTEAEVLEVKAAKARQTLPAEDVSQSAEAEAKRCLQCGEVCGKCVEVCPMRANMEYEALPVSFDVPVAALREGRLLPVGRERFTIAQPRQTLHLPGLCCECGNCATFCVRDARPWVKKPRLCLDDAEFAACGDDAWRIEPGLARRRAEGREMSLRELEGGWLFEDEDMSAEFDTAFTLVSMTLKRPFEGRRSLRPAAEMMTLYRNIQGFEI